MAPFCFGRTRKRARRALRLRPFGPFAKLCRSGHSAHRAARPNCRRALLRVSQGRGRGRRRLRLSKMLVGLGGLEPPTSRLSSARSNQLSYKPEPCAGEECSPPTRDRARPRRKRNEDGGIPHDRPDWPYDLRDPIEEPEETSNSC